MSGSMMDTTNTEIVNETYFNCLTRSISNLYGIQFFDKLKHLVCAHNNLTSLPNLPNTLDTLECYVNKITSISSLPNSLRVLSCSQNSLTSLPKLPDSLRVLDLWQNNLTSLPILPDSLMFLECSYNYLTSLPNIPISLKQLNCTYNPNLFCLPPVFQDKIETINVRDNTRIICLPNSFSYTYSSDGSGSLPICSPDSGCPIVYNIAGNIHEDTSTTCLLDSLHNGIRLQNVKLKKYKNGILDHQLYCTIGGYYSFDADITDSIDIVVDTTGKPYSVSCPIIGRRSLKLTLSDSIFYNQDFGLKCTGVDLGVQSIYGTLRKGFTRPVYINAGDLTRAFNLNCGKGISGTVTTTISGSASYDTPFTGALTPSSVSASSITYTISDFGAINIDSAFNILVKVDSSAVLGSNICISTVVSTSSVDINHANDSLTYCGIVVNSFDPNDKLVYPKATIGAGEWLTYTINFQNTGTDTAYHIIVRDTLDSNLDLGSFTYLASSHQPQIDIDGNAVMFNFPQINLLDSFHNEPKSHGWVQYKIKSLISLPPFAIIKNKASIYFDNNDPIVTNTTSNINSPLHIQSNNHFVDFKLSPNPAASFITVLSTEAGEFKLFNLLGSEVYHSNVSKPNTALDIHLPQMADGLYIYQFNSENGATSTGKLFIQSK